MFPGLANADGAKPAKEMTRSKNTIFFVTNFMILSPEKKRTALGDSPGIS